MHTLLHIMYTHNTLSLGYETLEYECRHQNNGAFKAWWVRDTVWGLEFQKATEIVTLPINVIQAWDNAHTDRYVH